MKKFQIHRNLYVNRDITNLKVRAGYKKYNDYGKIYCLDSQRSLLAGQGLGKYKIRFMMPQYNYSEILLLSLETALANLKKGGGKVLLGD